MQTYFFNLLHKRNVDQNLKLYCTGVCPLVLMFIVRVNTLVVRVGLVQFWPCLSQAALHARRKATIGLMQATHLACEQDPQWGRERKIDERSDRKRSAVTPRFFPLHTSL